MEILIKNALLPDGKGTKVCDICISGSRILSVGSVPDGFSPNETIDGGSRLLCVPALVNSHTHAYMTVLRGCADDLPFEEWLFGRIMPREEKLTPEQAYQSSLLACCEMIRHGTGTFCDMHMFPDSSAKAASVSGMRAVITRGLSGPDGGQRRLDEQFAEIERWKDEKRLSFMLAPHSVYTCGEDYLVRIAEISRETGLGINIHLSESVSEVENCIRDHGDTPVGYIDRLGLLGKKTLAAHCVHLTENDISRLAERNASVAANAKSNAKLGNGVAPIERLYSAGINICLGTDSAASNNSLNLFSEMNHTALIHKAATLDSTALDAETVFGFATVNGARALGISDLGRLEPGQLADLALIDTDCPQLTPLRDPYAALCYSADGSETETLIIDGRIIMKKRELLTVDEEELMYNIRKIAEEI